MNVWFFTPFCGPCAYFPSHIRQLLTSGRKTSCPGKLKALPNGEIVKLTVVLTVPQGPRIQEIPPQLISTIWLLSKRRTRVPRLECSGLPVSKVGSTVVLKPVISLPTSLEYVLLPFRSVKKGKDGYGLGGIEGIDDPDLVDFVIGAVHSSRTEDPLASVFIQRKGRPLVRLSPCASEIGVPPCPRSQGQVPLFQVTSP